jgi:integrase
VLVAYRHGLRAAELVTLRWDTLDFAHGRLHIRRLKGGSESIHPLSGRELRALRRLKREQDPASPPSVRYSRARTSALHLRRGGFGRSPTVPITVVGATNVKCGFVMIFQGSSTATVPNTALHGTLQKR